MQGVVEEVKRGVSVVDVLVWSSCDETVGVLQVLEERKRASKTCMNPSDKVPRHTPQTLLASLASTHPRNRSR
jgi:hypothetical protein